MNMKHVKAPEHLKHQTISMMELQIKCKSKNRYMKGALITACIPVLFTLTAFSYSLFSGIDGDELALNARYAGDGIAQITVENLATKDLQFDERIALERWSTSEEVFELEQDMPVIKPGESAVITIDIPDEYVDKLEVPLISGDHYIFLLTTNQFAFGQTWMASIDFSDSLPTTQEDLPPPPVVPTQDNTNPDDVITIKDNFKYQNPLSKMEISFDYNDYQTDEGYAHAEIDLKAELGAEIYSFSNGTVLDTSFDEDMGRFIIIDHGDGLVSKYTHCSEILYDVGDTVTMDNVIAKVGKSGMATGAHLGFSIILNDVPINPKTILSFE